MNANTSALRAAGQQIWLDNITRRLLTSGTLARYVSSLGVSGLTSNPTIFEQAIANSADYDEDISRWSAGGLSTENVFFELALQDLTAAAELFRPLHVGSDGNDGWVSLEVSPLFAGDTANTIRTAALLHARAACPNLFIKIPGTPQGIPAIEQSIYAGVPVNVTLLFSSEQYGAAAQAYLRGIERRLAVGLDPNVPCVASLFVSRWDVAVRNLVPPALHNRLGLAIALQTHKAYCDLLVSDRWNKLAEAGARPQRLLWASTGTKDPAARDTLYVEALAAAHTINTIPEATLLAFADHGRVGATISSSGDDPNVQIEAFRLHGVDPDALAARLQTEGVVAFAQSWSKLMSRIEEKRTTPAPVLSR